MGKAKRLGIQKREPHLHPMLPAICSWRTLWKAWDRVEENDGVPGIDGETIEEFALDLEQNLDQLQRDLAQHAYRPQTYLRAWIPKPSGGTRGLTIPTVRDRVAISAAAIAVTPILEEEFESVSFGFRPGLGVPNAVYRIRQLYESGFRWVVDADIDAFFDTVDHELILKKLRGVIPDADLLDLVRRWLECPVWDEDRMIHPRAGLPQGAAISPVLANLYLDELDERLIREGLKVVRFADDFLVLARKRPAAEEALELTSQVLKEMKLQLHPEKTQVAHFDHGFRFLGHLFVRSVVLKSPNRRYAEWMREGGDLATLGSPAQVAESGAPKTERTAGRGKAEPVRSPANSGERPSPSSRKPVSRTTVSPSMRTLYLQEQGSLLTRQGERLVVKKGSEYLLEVPAMKVDQIFVFGRCGLTTPVITYLLGRETPVFFFSSRGRYYGVFESPTQDRVALHREQFQRMSDPEFRLRTARAIVTGKLHNSRVLLQRNQRRRGSRELDTILRDLVDLCGRVEHATTVEEVMGFEGAGTARYYDGLRVLLEGRLGFFRRHRRPPPDPVNSLLSFGYTLCFYNLFGFVRGRGLHPYVGLFHSIRDRHPALVSDLLEEFRAPVVDGLVLYLVNSRVLQAKDFWTPDSGGGGCFLRDAGRRIFIEHFERRMRKRITHQPSGRVVDWRRAMDLQALQMKQWIEGAISEYRPMVIR